MGRGSAGSHYPTFTAEFRSVFDHPAGGLDPSQRLFSLRQGTHSMADYAVEFCTMAANGCWNEAALMDAFYNGLTGAVKDELVDCEETDSLRKYINLAITLDNRLREHQRERGSTPMAGFFGVWPTCLGALWSLLSPHQRSRCNWEGRGSLPLSGSAVFGTGHVCTVDSWAT